MTSHGLRRAWIGAALMMMACGDLDLTPGATKIDSGVSVAPHRLAGRVVQVRVRELDERRPVCGPLTHDEECPFQGVAEVDFEPVQVEVRVRSDQDDLLQLGHCSNADGSFAFDLPTGGNFDVFVGGERMELALQSVSVEDLTYTTLIIDADGKPNRACARPETMRAGARSP